MIKKAIIICLSLFITLLMGCKKDKEKEVAEPSVIINLGEIGSSIKVLETLEFSLEASFPAGLKAGMSVIWLDDAALDTIYTGLKDSLLFSFSENYTLAILPDYSGKNLMFTFSITDILDRIAVDTLSLAIEESAIQFIQSRQVSGFNNFDQGSFLSLSADTVYFNANIQGSTQLKQSIDLVFCYTMADKRILASPSNKYIEETAWKDQSNALWPLFGAENITNIYTLSSSIDFDVISTAEEIANVLANQNNVVDSLTNIEVGQMIGLQLASVQGSKKGILRVTDLGGNSPSTATLTFEAKVQK
jgi:hypothetical protein